MSRNKEKIHWLQWLNIIVGLFSIILSFIVILNFGFVGKFLVFILAITLITISFARIINGLSDEKLPSFLKSADVFVGAVGLSFAAIAVLIPGTDIMIAIYFLSIGLGIQGIVRIAVGSLDTALSNWLRGLLISIGILTVFVTIIIFFMPFLDEKSIIILLACIFFVNGLGRMIKGISGRENAEKLENLL
jgi:uncharacterized membrane protein HdeD (DUF308 family)